MADLNALIAQGPQFHMPDPLGQYAKMQQLQQGQQANQLNQMKMAEYQRAAEETNALRQLDRSSPDYVNQLYKISPTQGLAYEKSVAESKNLESTGKKIKADTEAVELKKQLDIAKVAGSVLYGVNDQTSYDRAKFALSTFGDTSQYPDVFDPNFVKSEISKGLDLEKTITNETTKRGQDMIAGTAKAGQGVTMRGQDITAGTAKAGQGVTMRGQDMTAAPVAVVDPVTGKTVFVSREEALRGRMSPAGAKPVELKQVPVHAQKAIVGASTAIKKIDDAIAALDSATEEATGMKGYLPDMALNRMYPEGTEARAAVADIGSLVMHERSGAAVTASESPRLKPFIPLITDDKTTALKKLRRMRQIQVDDAEALAGTYNPEQGFREFKVATPAAAPAAAPAGVDAALWNVMTPEEKKLWQK